MSISFNDRVSVPADVLISHLEGESVLLNLQTENYFGLDEVGTSMWSALTSAPSIQAAYEQLFEEFDVDPDQLRRDLEQLTERLVGEGLLAIER